MAAILVIRISLKKNAVEKVTKIPDAFNSGGILYRFGRVAWNPQISRSRLISLTNHVLRLKPTLTARVFV